MNIRPLEGYDTYLEGIAVLGDELVVVGYTEDVADGQGELGLIAFPLDGGARTWELRLGPYTEWRAHGLTCASR